MSALSEKLAKQYGQKAARCFKHAQDHAQAGSWDEVEARFVEPNNKHAAAYAVEGFHWLRAQRAALAGDTTPKPYAPTHTPGQLAYEADVAAQPLYHDGAPRPTWADLGKVERWSWERNPTPRA
jgi:hypothetical protein